ncbi:MAG: hypothetical protein ACOCQX_03530 [Candidatus Nanoarchaeia archaeon]
MTNTFSLVFFFGLIILSILGFVFCILLFRATRGATKAWTYLSIYGIANAILGLLGLVRSFVSDTTLQAVYFLQAVCILAIVTLSILAANIFIKDFGLKQRFFSARNVLIFMGLVFVIVLGYNLTGFTAFWAQKFYSIAILLLVIGYILNLVPMSKLTVTTGKSQWFFLGLGWFLNALLIFSLLGGNCCDTSEMVEGTAIEACGGDVIFVKILPIACDSGFIDLYQLGLLAVLVGSAFIVLAEGMFWYKIARPGMKTK